MPTLALLAILSSSSADIGSGCAGLAGWGCGTLMERYAPPPLLVGLAVPGGAMMGFTVVSGAIFLPGLIYFASLDNPPNPTGFFIATVIGGAIGGVVGAAANGAVTAQRHGGNPLIVGGVTLAILSVTTATAIGVAFSSGDAAATVGVGFGGVGLAALAAGVAQAATAHPQQ